MKKTRKKEVKIGDSRVMLTDEYREMDFLSPLTRGGTTVHIHLYVADADKMADRAVGAKALKDNSGTEP